MDGVVSLGNGYFEGRRFRTGYNVLGELWQAEYDKKYASLQLGGENYKKRLTQLQRQGQDIHRADGKCGACGKKPIEKFICQCMGGVNDVRDEPVLELSRIDMTLEPDVCTQQRTDLRLPAYIFEKTDKEMTRIRRFYDTMLSEQRRKVSHQHSLTAEPWNPGSRSVEGRVGDPAHCSGMIHQQREEVASRRKYDFKEIRHHQRRCKAILQACGMIPRDAFRRPALTNKQRAALHLRHQRLNQDRGLMGSDDDSYRGLGSRLSGAMTGRTGISGNLD